MVCGRRRVAIKYDEESTIPSNAIPSMQFLAQGQVNCLDLRPTTFLLPSYLLTYLPTYLLTYLPTYGQDVYGLLEQF